MGVSSYLFMKKNDFVKSMSLKIWTKILFILDSLRYTQYWQIQTIIVFVIVIKIDVNKQSSNSISAILKDKRTLS